MKLRETICLREQQYTGKESHDIWKDFQHKFTKVTELGKYYKFFKILLQATIDSCLKQNVFAIELRHISGMLFDDNRVSMSFSQEMDIINDVV